MRCNMAECCGEFSSEHSEVQDEMTRVMDLNPVILSGLCINHVETVVVFISC